MAEYKNIVLLKGLESMEDYQFRTVKSLLRKELKLTKKLQEDYDRIQLADWMEDKFPKDAGLDKLIKVCEHIKDLKDLAKKLKTEKAKVQKKKQGKCKTAGKKKGQDELSSSESLFINKESYKSVPSSKKKRKAIAKTEGEKKNKLTQDQDHLPETSGTDIKTEEDCLQNSPKPPPTSPSSSSNKKKRKEITKTEGGKKKKLTQEQAQLPEPLGTDIKKDEDCLQTPPKPPPTPPSSSLNKKRKSMREEETGVKKSKAAKEPDQPPCCEEPTARCQSPILHSSSSASSNIPSATNQKSQPQNQNIPRGAVLHSEPLTVMVLTATEPFEYESPEHEVKNMLHATVATVSQYFHVKVFNINLKEKFTKKNFIIISNYFESKGILEINETSSVLEAAPDQMIEVPNSIIRNANASPKICDIQKGTSGAVFYGVFTLHKKTVNRKNTIYEIKDGSGSIEVVGSGKWHNINCKEGDKLHLFCFHLKTIDRQPKLVCGEHSFIKISKRGNVPKEPAKEEDHHHGPKQVMVLKVTEPFTYDLKEDKRMFHATVATETEFFRVKVFDTALKSKFIPRNIIAISDYFGCNGFLEIYRASCVSDVNVNPTMVISNTLRQRANATPKISYLFSQARGTFVSGEYLVNKKTERNKFIYYGIGDDTGKMEVVVYGRLTNVRCEPGSKLRLVCFELTSTEDGWQLRSVRHSYMQVINARK